MVSLVYSLPFRGRDGDEAFKRIFVNEYIEEMRLKVSSFQKCFY